MYYPLRSGSVDRSKIIDCSRDLNLAAIFLCSNNTLASVDVKAVDKYDDDDDDDEGRHMDIVKRNIWLNQLGQLDCCSDAAADRELPHKIVFFPEHKVDS
jgi:hypothetical protein